MGSAAEVIGGCKLKAPQAFGAKGGHSLDVRWTLARSHYASALTQPDDDAGREKRAAGRSRRSVGF